nr:MAG TPA: virulence associated protein E [Caudoviricetes sp.]
MRDYVSSTYANRLVTADVAKLILDRAVSSARPHDDFAEYLDALPAWDGVPRLDRWHAGVVDDPDDRLALRRFVISLVARTRRPGCEVGWIPVLVGAQDTLKTTTLKWLVDDRCYQMQNLDEPHLMEKLVRYPLVVWDEFHLSQSDRDPYVNRAKALITGSSDMWHENYSTSESEAARMWVMAATANSFDIPSSMEGTRRFMPVRIVSDGGPRGCDGAPLWRTEALREQIMAEAVAAFEAGEPFTLSDPVGREAQRRALSRVREDAPEAEDIARFLSQEWPSGWCAASADARAFYRRQRASTPNLEVQGVPGELTLLPVVTVKVLMQDALGLSPSSCSSQRVRTRVKAVLKDLGWTQGKRRIGGTSTAVWLRPAAEAAATNA